MVLINGAIKVLGANARIVQAYSLTCGSACAWCNHVNGEGMGFDVISKDLWKANTYVLIVCSYCNVS
jgi:hypothetical protein